MQRPRIASARQSAMRRGQTPPSIHLQRAAAGRITSAQRSPIAEQSRIRMRMQCDGCGGWRAAHRSNRRVVRPRFQRMRSSSCDVLQAAARSCQSARVGQMQLHWRRSAAFQAAHAMAIRSIRSIRADRVSSVHLSPVYLSHSPTRPCPAHTCPRFLRFFLRLAVCDQHQPAGGAAAWRRRGQRTALAEGDGGGSGQAIGAACSRVHSNSIVPASFPGRGPHAYHLGFVSIPKVCCRRAARLLAGRRPSLETSRTRSEMVDVHVWRDDS